MARLHSIGFELAGSVAAMPTGYEIFAVSADASPLSIQSTTKRSGTYALRCGGAGQPLVTGTPAFIDVRFIGTATTGPYYGRVYRRFNAFPSVEMAFFGFFGSGLEAWATIDGSGVLRLYDDAGLIGTAGSALSTGTFYRLELEYDASAAAGSDTIKLYVDGVEVAGSTTRSKTAAIRDFRVGGNLLSEANTAGEFYDDDIAINNSAAGGTQTGLPGAGSIVHLWPNGDGDADTNCTRSSAGTTPTGTDRGANYLQLGATHDKPSPNDATDFLLLTSNTSEVLVDCEASSVAGIGASDAVTLVQVGARVTGVTTSGATWIPRVMSQSGGTKATGATVAFGTTTWQTHDDTADVTQYKLTSYVDPQALGAWTPALLDTMQIGAATADGNPDTLITALWALVEYVPAEGGGAFEITADPGSVSVAGTAAALEVGRRIVAAAGSFGISGTAAALEAARKIAADSGTVAITGSAAALRAGRLVAAAAGAVAITGTAADLLYDSADPTLAAEGGAISISGTAAALRAGREIVAESAAFAITGTAASLRAGRLVSAGGGVFAITGTAAALRAARELIAGSGAFEITGQEATLTATTGYRIVAGAGSFEIVGTAAALLGARRLSAESGAWSISGTAAVLSHGFRLTATAGEITISGTVAEMLYGRRMAAAAGAYTITGTAATLFYGEIFSPGTIVVGDELVTLLVIDDQLVTVLTINDGVDL